MVKWWSKFRRWLIGKCIDQEEFWDRNIPTDQLTRDTDLSIKKDALYWESVASVLKNQAFMNELVILQESSQAKINKKLLNKDNLKRVSDDLLVLRGVRKVGGLIANAHNVNLSNKREND